MAVVFYVNTNYAQKHIYACMGKTQICSWKAFIGLLASRDATDFLVGFTKEYKITLELKVKVSENQSDIKSYLET